MRSLCPHGRIMGLCTMCRPEPTPNRRGMRRTGKRPYDQYDPEGQGYRDEWGRNQALQALVKAIRPQVIRKGMPWKHMGKSTNPASARNEAAVRPEATTRAGQAMESWLREPEDYEWGRKVTGAILAIEAEAAERAIGAGIDVAAVAASLPENPELDAIRRRSERWERRFRTGDPGIAEQDRAALLRLVDGLRILARLTPQPTRSTHRFREGDTHMGHQQPSNPASDRNEAPVAVRWAETWHDVQCGTDHPLSDHEPFDTDDSDISWSEIEEAAERNGLRFIATERAIGAGIDVERLQQAIDYADERANDRKIASHWLDDVVAEYARLTPQPGEPTNGRCVVCDTGERAHGVTDHPFTHPEDATPQPGDDR